MAQLPVAIKTVAFRSNASEVLSNYPEDVRDKIADFMANMKERSTGSLAICSAKPLMFVGPPGTGKTHLARAIADLMDLPIKYVNISEYKNDMSRSVQGSGCIYTYNRDFGIILDVLRDACGKENNFMNKVVVIDEIDKAMYVNGYGSIEGSSVYSFLHQLLDDGWVSKMPILRYGSASYDLSAWGIIVIGNKTFTDALGKTKAEALESRVNLVRFDQGFDYSQKKKIVEEHVRDYLSRKEQKNIDKALIDAIIRKDILIGNKGVRELLGRVNSYIDRTLRREDITRLTGKPVNYDDLLYTSPLSLTKVGKSTLRRRKSI